jgi:hypothetical protein
VIRAGPGCATHALLLARHGTADARHNLVRLVLGDLMELVVPRGAVVPHGDADEPAPAGRRARRAVEVLGGRGTRSALLTAQELLAGLVVALLTVHLAGSWEQY